MVMLTAPSGDHAGQPIWSCSTYPMCRGMVAVADDPPPEFATERASRVAGGSAQAHDRAGRITRVWPVAFGLMLMAILFVYLLTQAFTSPA